MAFLLFRRQLPKAEQGLTAEVRQGRGGGEADSQAALGRCYSPSLLRHRRPRAKLGDQGDSAFSGRNTGEGCLWGSTGDVCRSHCILNSHPFQASPIPLIQAWVPGGKGAWAALERRLVFWGSGESL